MVAATSDLAELVFHGLAFVPIAEDAPPGAQAASLFNPCYGRWFSERAGRETVRWFEDDAALLARLLEEEVAAQGISCLALLHPTIDGLLHTAEKPLLELAASQVHHVGALSLLRSLHSPAIEIFRADIALAARAFRSAFGEHVRPRLERLAQHVERRAARLHGLPAWLDLSACELSLALGNCGRALADRVIVGVGVPDLDDEAASEQAVRLIVHEQAVQRATRFLESRGRTGAWAAVEPLALAIEARIVRGTEIEKSHLEWLFSLSRAGLEQETAELDAQADELARD